jgi:hypothetical protein
VVMTAAIQMRHSRGEIFQKPKTWRGVAMRSPTAWMMMAERPALGIPRRDRGSAKIFENRRRS